MKITTKFFLAVLALVFAVQVIFDIQGDYNSEKAFLASVVSAK
jgi:hypothetical protein